MSAGDEQPPEHVPTPSPPGERCPLCGGPLHEEQGWCLRCGAAARTRLAPPPRWRWLVATLLVVIVLSVGGLTAALVSLLSGHRRPGPAAVGATGATAPGFGAAGTAATAVTTAVTSTAPPATITATTAATAITSAGAAATSSPAGSAAVTATTTGTRTSDAAAISSLLRKLHAR